jgi:toxin ParE1/3/4
MKLRFRPAALADLEDIYDYIAEDNPAAAGEFVALIRAKCAFLQKTPCGGRIRPEIRDDLRSFSVKTYVIFYRACDDVVEIVNVIRGSRDIETLFSKDDEG